MDAIFPGIYTWGASYPDRPWDLNGYALVLDGHTLLIDPPAPDAADWPQFDALPSITRIILTNRDHLRDTELFQERYGAHVIAGINEVAQLSALTIDETVHENDLIAGALRVIDLPGKSPGEIGLLLERTHPLAGDLGGILFLGDAIIGHPAGALGLIPEHKLDEPAVLRQSLRKLLTLDFEVLLPCDGKPILSGAKTKVEGFLGKRP